MDARLLIDGSEVSSNRFESMNNADRYVFGGHKTLDLDATEKNITIQYSAPSNPPARIKDARVIALDLDNIEHRTIESESESSRSVDGWENKVFLNTGGLSDGDYLLIASADVTADSTSYSVNVQLRDSDGTTIADFWREPTVADEYYTFMTHKLIHLPGPNKYTIRYRRESGGSHTAKIKNARITLIKLEPERFYYSESEGESSSWSNWATKTSLSVKPPTPGDYLIIGSALIKQSDSTTYGVHAKLVVNGNTTEMVYYPKDKSDYVSFFTIKKINFDTSQHDISLQYGRIGGGRARIKNARIIAIRLSPEYSGTGIIADSEKVSYGSELNSVSALVSSTSNVSTNYQLLMYNFNRSVWEVNDCDNKDVTAGSLVDFQCDITQNPEHYISSDNRLRIAFGTISYSPLKPSKDTQIRSFSASGLAGAGVIATDGKYLYVKRWGTYPGPAAFNKIGTGYQGTVRGKNYGAFPSNAANSLSATYHSDGYIYNPRSNAFNIEQWDPNTGTMNIVNVPDGLIRRDTGTVANGYQLITSDGRYIYNLAYGRGGSSYNGWTVKVFDPKDNWKVIREFETGTSSYYTDGLLADGAYVYPIEWKGSNAARITRIDAVNGTIYDQWTINQGDTDVINGQYDWINDKVWLGALKKGTIYEYPGIITVTSQTEKIKTEIDFIQFSVSTGQGDYYFRKVFNIANLSRIEKAKVYVYSDDRAEVYVNGFLVDNDTTRHNATYWNREVDVSKSYLKDGNNIVAVRLHNGDNISAKFDLKMTALETRRRFIVVMSDGITGFECGNCGAEPGCAGSCDATTGTQDCHLGHPNCCWGTMGDCTGPQCDIAINDAICSSCKARSEISSTVYSIGVGPITINCTNALTTLQEIANCGEGKYCGSAEAKEVEKCYLEFAEKIVNLSYEAQLMNISGNLTMNNTLYPDSNIWFSYSPITAPIKYGETLITLESSRFGNKAGNGSFWVPLNTRPVDAKVTSYSGPYWTDKLMVNSSNTTWQWEKAYELSDYGSNYEPLGDPYTVNIPADMIGEGVNFVKIGTGKSPTESMNASPDDKVIYSVATKTFTGYSEPKKNTEGCNWTVEFFDNSTGVLPAPYGYIGPKNCSYTNATYQLKLYDNQSSIDDAVYRLFSQLDTAPRDGRLDVKFDPRDIVIETTTVGGIRSLWGPIRVKLILWT